MSSDFFTRDPYLRNLQQGLAADSWSSNLTLKETLIGSNIQSISVGACNISAQTKTFSNLVSGQVRTSVMTACNLTASNATVSQLTSGQVEVGNGTFSNLTSCNINTVDLEAGVISAYSTVTTELSGASCSLSNVASYYVDTTELIASNALLLGQMYDGSNDVIINAAREYCGQMEYSNLLHVPVPGSSNLGNYLQDLL